MRREDGTILHHRVQFYEAHSTLIESIREVVVEALKAGDAAVVIATERHRRALESLVPHDIADFEDVRARGQYVALDAAATLARLMRGGRPDRERFRAVVGGVVEDVARDYPRIAAFGEMVGLLVEAGDPQAALQLERFWNDLQADRPVFSLLCGYSQTQLTGAPSPSINEEVCAVHSGLVPAGAAPSGRSLEALEITQALVQSAPLQAQPLDFFVRVGSEFGLTADVVAASLCTMEAAGEAARDERGRWRRPVHSRSCRYPTS